MKTSIRKFSVLSLSLCLTFSLLFTNVIAQDGSKNTATVGFKFIGNSNDLPLFQLDIQFADKNEFTITIRDKDDNIVYADKINKSISRKFQLDAENIDAGVLRVEVKDKNTRKTEVFEITRNTRFVEESVITKVK